ncbi:MAG TPA: peptidoglycan-binding protein [Bacillales bacterium]|nr:peptidoglycan-binding protein [Bacillales bacterium]
MTVTWGKWWVSGITAGALAFGSFAAGPGLTEVSASTQTAMNTNQLLKMGDRGADVKTLQTKLRSLNYYWDALDGIFGSHTRAAVISYQRDHGLAVDGIAGPQTLTSLFPGQANSSYLDYGDRGASVSDLQQQLKRLDYYTYGVDGIFGHMTEQAVENFQADHQLTIDGIAGPQTLTTLDHAVTAAKIIEDAKALVGTPYQWGGDNPQEGFDCSGFIHYVFAKNGISVPRTTSSLWDAGRTVAYLHPGDLVFFETYKDGPSHVGIYLDGNRFIHCGSHGVVIESLGINYWSSRYLGGKRLF